MQTGFLYKKLLAYALVVVTLLLTALGLLYRFYPQTVDVSIKFHFLVSEEKSVEAGAEFIKLEGGAGYLLRHGGKDYAVLSVYLREKDGLAVQEVLSSQSRQTRLLSVCVTKLCFRGKNERNKKGIYVGALQSLYSCLVVLEDSVARLEKGLTQEKAKGILTELKNQLSFMSEIYADGYAAFSSLCLDLAKKLEDKKEKILYVSDLRYLLCETVEGCLDLTEEFT